MCILGGEMRVSTLDSDHPRKVAVHTGCFVYSLLFWTLHCIFVLTPTHTFWDGCLYGITVANRAIIRVSLPMSTCGHGGMWPWMGGRNSGMSFSPRCLTVSTMLGEKKLSEECSSGICPLLLNSSGIYLCCVFSVYSVVNMWPKLFCFSSCDCWGYGMGIRTYMWARDTVRVWVTHSNPVAVGHLVVCTIACMYVRTYICILLYYVSL